MNTVYSKEHAKSWFLRHNEGNLRCLRTDEEALVAESYPQAEAFYDERPWYGPEDGDMWTEEEKKRECL